MHDQFKKAYNMLTFRTAVKGVCSGTLRTLKGSFGSLVSVILNVTLDAEAIFKPFHLRYLAKS